VRLANPILHAAPWRMVNGRVEALLGGGALRGRLQLV
jgi:hypothetical protein